MNRIILVGYLNLYKLIYDPAFRGHYMYVESVSDFYGCIIR